MTGRVRDGMVTIKQYEVVNSDKISNNLPDKVENPRRLNFLHYPENKRH